MWMFDFKLVCLLSSYIMYSNNSSWKAAVFSATTIYMIFLLPHLLPHSHRLYYNSPSTYALASRAIRVYLFCTLLNSCTIPIARPNHPQPYLDFMWYVSLLFDGYFVLEKNFSIYYELIWCGKSPVYLVTNTQSILRPHHLNCPPGCIKLAYLPRLHTYTYTAII